MYTNCISIYKILYMEGVVMICKYEKYIDILLDGKLSDTKTEELMMHSKYCDQCSSRLQEINDMDNLIKLELNNYEVTSSKNEIMERVKKSKNKVNVISGLYNIRKYACALAGIIILVIGIQHFKPYLYDVSHKIMKNRSTASNLNTTPTKDEKTFEDLLGTNADNITKITMFDGDSGKSVVLNKESDIKTLIKLLSGRKYINPHPLGNREGFMYATTFYTGDKEVFSITIEPDMPVIKGNVYNVDKKIDIDAVTKLFNSLPHSQWPDISK